MGAWCFVASRIGERKCIDPAICHAVVMASRQQIFQRIQARAAAGDPVFVDLAEVFTSPDQIMSAD